VLATKYRGSFIIVKFLFDLTCLPKREGRLHTELFPGENIFNPIYTSSTFQRVPPPPPELSLIAFSDSDTFNNKCTFGFIVVVKRTNMQHEVDYQSLLRKGAPVNRN